MKKSFLELLIELKNEKKTEDIVEDILGGMAFASTEKMLAKQGGVIASFFDLFNKEKSKESIEQLKKKAGIFAGSI